jgi:hypothetical protein
MHRCEERRLPWLGLTLCRPLCLPQVFILDSLGRYTPTDAREAETIIERVIPRLNHQNPAVVLSAVKIVVK